MPDFEDMKETGRGGAGQLGGANETPSAIVSDIFQRIGQLNGFIVVAYVAPVSGGVPAPARRTPMALLNIADQVAAAGKTASAKAIDLKGVMTSKSLYTAE
jgi:hypothetical protein